MSLRTTTLLVIGGALAGLLALLFFAGRLIILNSFVQLEQQQVEQNLERVLDALTAELDALNTTAADYAGWDDTYAFAADGNQAYIDSNLTPQTFTNLELNLIFIVGTDGHMQYGGGFDLAEGELVGWPDSMRQHLEPGGALLGITSETDSRQGLLLLPEGPLLVAARPVLTSDYSGPIGGVLLMGRFLDADVTAKLASITHVDLALHPVSAIRALASGAPSPALLPRVEPLGPDTVAGFAPLQDVYGQTILEARIELPRSVYQEGLATLNFFLLALAASGAVFGLVNWGLMERFVLSRVARISTRVVQIGAHHDLTLRVPVSGSDELTGLATGINGMLQSLATSRQALGNSEQKFRTLAETSAAAIFITQDGETRYANARAEVITGFNQEELRVLSLNALARSPVTAPAANVAREDAAARQEVEIFTRAGDPRWLEMSAGPIEYEGQPATIVTAYDITDRKRAEQRAQESNDQLSGVVRTLEQRSQESALLSELSDLLQASPTATDGYATVGQFLPRLFPALGGSILYVYRASRNYLEAAAHAGAASPAALRQFAPDGCLALRLGRVHLTDRRQPGPTCAHIPREPAASAICVPLVAHGEALGVLHLWLVPSPTESTDTAMTLPEAQRWGEMVAERLALSLSNIRLREALQHQAVRDPLTGLFNRRYMQETLDREVSRALRYGHPLSTIFLDLDHFKIFNDTNGHDAGDALLRALGGLLQSRLRVEDVVCRYGGEEFLIILPEAALEAARQRADGLRADIRALAVRHYDQILGGVSASMGVASMPEHGTTGEQVIRAADRALYQAKQAGRDCVIIANPDDSRPPER